jgi:hypothetical protein
MPSKPFTALELSTLHLEATQELRKLMDAFFTAYMGVDFGAPEGDQTVIVEMDDDGEDIYSIGR